MHTIEQTLIAPRYLAGAGDPAWITVPLHRACGWRYGHDPLMPRVHLSSPDQQATLRLHPAPEQHWWTIQHARTCSQPAWRAKFGAHTPVEIIAGFTDALTHPAASTASRASDPFEPLRQAGWRETNNHDGFVSPDGIANVKHFAGSSGGTWFAEMVVSEDDHGVVWWAYLDGNTPLHLITAFTRALADDTPLPRDPMSVPAQSIIHVHSTTHEVPVSTVALALENRVKDLAARNTSTPTPRPRPPHIPPSRRTR